jgi:hypothetical protein
MNAFDVLGELILSQKDARGMILELTASEL